jgi:hypothetical protein
VTLALDASTPTQATKTATGNTVTTASFTAPTSSLLVAFYMQDEGGQVNTSIADTGGLTWTRVIRLCTNTVGEANTPTPSGTAQDGYIAVWWATTSSATSRTITVTESGAGGTGRNAALAVKVFTDSGGAPSVGAVATKGGSASAPSHSVTTTANNSWVWALVDDWSQAGLGTAGSNQTLTDEYNPSGFITTHVFKQNATTSSSGTAVTMNLTAPTSQTWNEGVVEILANPGAGGPDSNQATPRAFPPFAPPFTSPMAQPLQLMGDQTVSTLTNVTLSDTGTGTDALTVSATAALADTGTGADALTVTTSLSLADTGAGADALTVITTAPIADTALGADALSVNITDYGYVAAPMPFPAFGQPFLLPTPEPIQMLGSTEVNAATQITLTDTGTLTDDTLTVTATAALTDTGTGADALTVTVTVPLTDTGSGADALTITTTVPLPDTATGTDALAANITDYGYVAGPQPFPAFGQPFLLPTPEPLQLLGSTDLQQSTTPNLPDTAAGADALTVTATAVLADTATGADALVVTVVTTLTDLATGADAMTVTTVVPLADTGAAADALAATATVPLPDTGTGADAISHIVAGVSAPTSRTMLVGFNLRAMYQPADVRTMYTVQQTRVAYVGVVTRTVYQQPQTRTVYTD